MIRLVVLCGYSPLLVRLRRRAPGRAGWDDLIRNGKVIAVGVIERSSSVRRMPTTAPASRRIPDRHVITRTPECPKNGSGYCSLCSRQSASGVVASPSWFFSFPIYDVGTVFGQEHLGFGEPFPGPTQ